MSNSLLVCLQSWIMQTDWPVGAFSPLLILEPFHLFFYFLFAFTYLDVMCSDTNFITFQALLQMQNWFVRFPTILQDCESTVEILRGHYAHSVGCYSEASYHFLEASKVKSISCICLLTLQNYINKCLEYFYLLIFIFSCVEKKIS